MENNCTANGTPIPPKELHGKLVAWDSAHRRIVAFGTTYREVKQAAHAAGEDNPIFEQIPKSDERFIGSA
jgi:hypothetical protein